MATRVLAPLVYGAGHPYAIPFTGSGYEADIAALTRDDLLAWHGEQIRPDTATVMVVGDTTLAEIMPLLEKHFGDWKARGRPQPSSGDPGGAARQGAARVPDRPARRDPGQHHGGAAGCRRSTDPGTIDLEFANAVFGGDFTSRLNMNLREDKHWSYGARSSASNTLGQRLWTASAPVQIDKTIESIKEMQREIADFASGRRRSPTRKSRALPGDHHAQPARQLRDRRARAVDHRRHQPLRPPGRLRAAAQGADRGDDAGDRAGRRPRPSTRRR